MRGKLRKQKKAPAKRVPKKKAPEKKDETPPEKQTQTQTQYVVVNPAPAPEKKPRKRRAPRKKPIEETVMEPQLFRQLPPVVYMTPPQVTHYAGGFPREDFVSVPIAEKPSISIEPVSKPAKILGAEPKSLRFEMGTQTPLEEFIRVPIAEPPKYTPIKAPERRIFESAPKSVQFGPVLESQTLEFQKPKREKSFALEYPFMETPVPLEESPQMIKMTKPPKMEKSTPIQPRSAPILQMPEQPKTAPSLGEAVMGTGRTLKIPRVKPVEFIPVPIMESEPVQLPSRKKPPVKSPEEPIAESPIPSVPSILQPANIPTSPILEPVSIPQVQKRPSTAIIPVRKLRPHPQPIVSASSILEPTIPILDEAVMRTGKTLKIPRIKSAPSILQPEPEPSVPILEEPPVARLSILQPADIAPAMAEGEEEFGVTPEMVQRESTSARKETRGRPRSVGYDLSRATRATIEEIYINEVGRPTTGMSRADMIKEIIYKRENP